MRPPSLSKVLVVTVLLASALVWCAIYGVGFALMYWPDTGGFDREQKMLSNSLLRIAESSRSIGQLRASAVGVNSVVAEFAGEIAHERDAAGYNVWRQDGQWVAGSPNVPKLHTGRSDISGFHDTEIMGEAYRVYTAWTKDRALRIDVMQSEQGRWANFNKVMLSPASVVAPLLVGFPLLLLPVFFVVRCGLKPLQKLSCELSARTPDDLKPVEIGEMVTELQPVVSEINSTLTRLDALLRRERTFLADAAHELRTPLAVISAQVDDVLQAETPEARKAAELCLQAGLSRTNRLVSQLLTLARFEARADKGEPADVADVVRETLANHAHEARAKSIQLAYRGPDQAPVGCARHSMESILGNLIGNAIRYGREGGQVVVRLNLEPSLAFDLWVCDDGPGIPLDERPRMFDRFWRGSQSGASGSGLGLAIVAAAVRQHNARIRVEDGIGGQGLCVIISVPSPDGVFGG